MQILRTTTAALLLGAASLAIAQSGGAMPDSGAASHASSASMPKSNKAGKPPQDDMSPTGMSKKPAKPGAQSGAKPASAP